jgi:transcriptional regulator with XRE-family HTH domain
VAFTESVSARVREELKTQDVSFRELARRMGVSIAYVSRRLSDEPDVHFRIDELEKVANALGVPVQRFVTNPRRRSAGAA